MAVPPKEATKQFRDKISTVNEQGGRVWVYPTKPFGKLYNARTVLSWVYLAVFIALPFIKINDRPVFLFNILESKFIFFGKVFWPQDFFVFAVGMLVFLLIVILFTIVFGRVFCGWVCPQTIFMEMVFRKIEYLIEGNANEQKLLNKQPWTGKKIFKKTLKHVVFFALAFGISNIFLAYIVGVDSLKKIITEPLQNHITLFISLLAFAIIFYVVYAFVREIVCIVICPYGRLQGVMLDKNSVVVAYDYIRGEPRGKIKKNEASTENKMGDCVDCGLCVRVCPTNIDIRNGTQLECINCTACIDACNSIMSKVNRPKNLIKYASENNIKNKQKVKFTYRMAAYSAALAILVGILTVLLATRSDLDIRVTRAPGTTYQELENNKISNLYNIKIANKTFNELPFSLSLTEPLGEIKWVNNQNLTIPKEGITQGTFFVTIDKNKLSGYKTNIAIKAFSNNEEISTINTTFISTFDK